ncbi:MAG: tRNA lysidine(34) synthetase TilS [Rickettsiaceae bacterium]|nr:tRNA lysidine(34) synthetase TilS [Rickettsiaceae bacterium]
MKSTILENLFNQTLNAFVVKGNKIAVAVSGGPDSLALLHFASSWAKDSAVKVVALTVDHRLRDESQKEAEYVASICKSLEIPHHILTWHRKDGDKVMHDASRHARYNLLAQYCRENNIDTILTAHNADDKIENFLIRLSKASGLLGLMQNDVNFYGNIRILRPLSSVYKKDLEDYIANIGVEACYDPSNSDPKYQRSNIRKWLSMMPKELEPELFKDRMLKSISYLSESGAHIRDLFISEIAEKAVIHPSGYATYKIGGAYQDITTMVLSHLLTIVSGQSFIPRAEAVEKLYDALMGGSPVRDDMGCHCCHSCEGRNPGEKKSHEVAHYQLDPGSRLAGSPVPDDMGCHCCHFCEGRNPGEKKSHGVAHYQLDPGSRLAGSPVPDDMGCHCCHSCESRNPGKFKATLHGCIVEKIGNRIYFYRSFGRNMPDAVPLSADIKWDGRWRSHINNKNFIVTNLSMKQYSELKKDAIFAKKSIGVKKQLLFTLPVILDQDQKVLAIPHIDYYNGASFMEGALVFEPNYMSRLVDFCWGKV